MDLTYVSATIGIAIAFACAWYCRRLAREQGRSAAAWTVLGFVFTVVAVPLLLVLPGRVGEGSEPEPTEARE